MEQARQATRDLFVASNWLRHDIDTGRFVLASWQPPALNGADTIRVYIEGDGLAWLNSTTPSFDPTPLDPVAFKLATADSSQNAVYLARPCQFVGGTESRNCERRFWTSHRFSEEVITATNSALNEIRTRLGASGIELVGYSGGAAVAVLVAARRDDITRIITVAGNLDHAHWTERLGHSPLWGSLNPPEVAEHVAHIPQRHFIGDADRTIAVSDLLSYQSRLPPDSQSELVRMDGYSHHCCWLENWARLLEANSF